MKSNYYIMKIKLNKSHKLFIKKQKEKSRILRKKYIAQKKTCLSCGKNIPFKKRANKFCNHFCAATFNNKKIDRHKTKLKKCLWCKKQVKRHTSKYCSLSCFREHQFKIRYTKIEKDGEFKNYGWASNTIIPKKYLIKKYGHRCMICGIETWIGKPIPLILDHIDGNAENWKLINLRLVCGNCDMQLPTYKNKNKGKSKRKYRMQPSILEKINSN